MMKITANARTRESCNRILAILEELTIAEASQTLAMASGLLRMHQDHLVETTRFNQVAARSWPDNHAQDPGTLS